MCGACGSGIAAEPFEALLLGSGPVQRRALSEALNRQLPEHTPARVKPSPFGASYLIEYPNGRWSVAPTLMDAVQATVSISAGAPTDDVIEITGTDLRDAADQIVAVALQRAAHPVGALRVTYRDRSVTL